MIESKDYRRLYRMVAASFYDMYEKVSRRNPQELYLGVADQLGWIEDFMHLAGPTDLSRARVTEDAVNNTRQSLTLIADSTDAKTVGEHLRQDPGTCHLAMKTLIEAIDRYNVRV